MVRNFSIAEPNPHQPGSVPHWQTYEIDEAEGMTLFIALSVEEALRCALSAGLLGMQQRRLERGSHQRFEVATAYLGVRVLRSNHLALFGQAYLPVHRAGG